MLLQLVQSFNHLSLPVLKEVANVCSLLSCLLEVQFVAQSCVLEARCASHTLGCTLGVAIESCRLTFTMNGDVINQHVTSSADDVHNEILTFCTPGTMFHHKCILVSSGVFFNIL